MVTPAEETVIIEGTNIVKKHMKPSKKYAQGGIIEKEAAIHISNVMLVCPKCSKLTRIGINRDGEQVQRVCKHCKALFD